MNIPETVFYSWFLYVAGLQLTDWSYEGISQFQMKGDDASFAVLLCFSGAVMTVSKTLLYCKFSLFQNCNEYVC